ncbi:MAG: heavy metal-binding domain-containing protein [Candidatus Pacebacteria bacterium]|nr:heavy metal-binding domain-containing protein [Candidatus Paceibacterota bacterium]
MATTGLSGHEMYCLDKVGYKAGNIAIGNSVYSLGLINSIGSGVRAVVGGEISQITKLIEDGRESAYDRLVKEAESHGANGVTGVDSSLVDHGTNIEFLSIGSSLHGNGEFFTTSADGQELYCQIDAGYTPKQFVFGNVAYSIGITRGIIGGLKTLARGEIKEYSNIFNQTRNLALSRIVDSAKKTGNVNAVVGIETTILPVSTSGYHEMLMVGTASHNPALGSDIVTSDLTCQEMWNLTKMGYAPMRLLLGTSVYSLGFVGGVTSFLKSFARGEINELTTLIYDAREEALAIINKEAEEIGADEVVGVKTCIFQLGSGLIEFLAVGTAVKKMPGMVTKSAELIPQAIIQDKDTFIDTADQSFGVDLNSSGR